MIPRRYIQEWTDNAPWSSPYQTEQDLILSRTLISIFSDHFLNKNLVFRGGTALHKLYLNPAPRYSEDIDLVQNIPGQIKPILARLKEVIGFFEEKRVVKTGTNNNTVIYRFNSEFNPDVRLKLKVEINCREHFSVYPLVSLPYRINNSWFTGQSLIQTYQIPELLGTKIRALYQRRKGRDLFDLFYASSLLKLDYDAILHAYYEYMRFGGGTAPSKKQYLANINQKEIHPDFSGDMEGILRLGISYNQAMAFEWLRDEIVSRMK